jgi:hypothetical protein
VLRTTGFWMTLGLGFSTVTAMFTEAQIQYLEEVLGASVNSYRAAPAAAPQAQPEVVVLTPALDPEAQNLLTKILASVQLTDFTQQETLGDLNPQFILDFTGAENGRQDTRFGFARVDSMLGAGPEVTARKKETWSLLKLFQFAREHSAPSA